MDVDRLFLHTLRDLEERASATDEYKVLMSAALLRKLILDADRLVDQVNRTYKLDLRFRISSVSPFERMIYDTNPLFWIIEDGLDPEILPISPPLDAKRDQFLTRRVMCFQGSWITVRDVIHQLANIEGAVHAGKAREQRQIAFREAEKFYSHGHLPGAISQVRTIGRIVVRGLRPLHDAVVAAGAATWASVSRDGSIALRRNGPEEATSA
ncbi:hypothetical protein AB0M35_29090 [Micromonospora sp. NPDC051196]|uniref:hypothetical protein n=1 Tax=Micromonospora sp. NPDC051196 TaxID=3155281 RepID=UPI00343089C2